MRLTVRRRPACLTQRFSWIMCGVMRLSTVVTNITPDCRRFRTSGLEISGTWWIRSRNYGYWFSIKAHRGTGRNEPKVYQSLHNLLSHRISGWNGISYQHKYPWNPGPRIQRGTCLAGQHCHRKIFWQSFLIYDWRVHGRFPHLEKLSSNTRSAKAGMSLLRHTSWNIHISSRTQVMNSVKIIVHFRTQGQVICIQ